jgi:hypothetical protein
MHMNLSLKTLYVCVSLIAIAVLASGCGMGKHSGFENGGKRYLYAHIKGEVYIHSRRYQVDRVFMADDSLGLRLVSSSIVVVDDVDGFVSRFSKQILEYCLGDSLYVFDSSDSSYIVMNVKELQGLRAELLPYSASWIFGNGIPINLSGAVLNDTLWNGLECKQYVLANFACITFRNHNLSLHCEYPQFVQNEDVVKLVSDTLLSPELFALPKGFMKMQNSERSIYSFSN